MWNTADRLFVPRLLFPVPSSLFPVHHSPFPLHHSPFPLPGSQFQLPGFSNFLRRRIFNLDLEFQRVSSSYYAMGELDANNAVENCNFATLACYMIKLTMIFYYLASLSCPLSIIFKLYDLFKLMLCSFT